MNKDFIITVFSENKVGLLSQITTVFTHRNVNIESLTVSESAIEGVHKYTILVHNEEEKVANLVKQIEKLEEFLKTGPAELERLRKELADMDNV
ncbi:MAG: acetolactate synthase small subunit [Bacteroidaceae bacterium]|nr:acetolactate synthase small subunit [Bacteroidaceae bacterium]